MAGFGTGIDIEGGGGGGLPPKPGGGGGGPGGPFAGGAVIQAPSDLRPGLTPNALAARYAKGKPLNVVTIPGQKWFGHTIEVPTVLTPLFPLDFMLLYAPEYQTRSVSPYLGAAPDTWTNKNFQTSVGPGNIYLPWPGSWQIYNPSAVEAPMLVVDATDPLVGVRYLSEPGNHAVTQTNNPAVPASPAITTILASNRYRTGIILNNDHATIPLRLGFMSSVVSGGATPIGLLVAPGAIVQFAGSTVVKHQAQITAVGGVGSYQCFELF
jgi:hypothetical protein